MRTLGRWLYPTRLGTWLWLVLILSMTFLVFALAFTGQTDYALLRDGGVHTTLPILDVAERDASGSPTKVVVQVTGRGGYPERRTLTDAQGSVVGNSVRVITVAGPGAFGDVVWTETEFANADPTRDTIRVLLGGLLLAFLPVAAWEAWQRSQNTAVPETIWSDPTWPARSTRTATQTSGT